jgi:hypothetical protein
MVRKLVTLLLLAVCPSTLVMAEQPTAMLYAKGDVTLNGSPAAKSTSIFSGDRIDTAGASGVFINRGGTSLLVDPNSTIQYQDNGFTILKGLARVRTSEDMTVHAGPLSVMPKANAAKFDVSNDGKTVLVASREGVLTLTDGTETATLQPGYAAKVNLDDAQDQDQGPKPAATTKGERNKHKKAIIIILIASAVAATAIVCGLECGGGGPTAVTPVTP